MCSRGSAQNIHTSQIYFSMDNSSLPSTPTSTEEDREQRWPDEVSPKPALTFAVLWDPVEGMVTFSGPQLLDTDNSECSSVFEDKPLQKACDDGPKSRYEGAPPLHVRTFLHRSPRYKHGGSSLLRTSSTFERKVRNVPLRPARSLHNPRANKVEASISESNNLSPPVGILRSWTQRSPRKGGLREESLSWRSGTWISQLSPTLRSGISPKGLSHRAPPSPNSNTPSRQWRRLFSLPSEVPMTPRRRLHKQLPDSGNHDPIPVVGTGLWNRLDMASPKPNPEELKPLSFLSRSPSKYSSAAKALAKKGSITDMMLPRRMASLRVNRQADKGWVYIEVKTTIKQRYIPDLDEE